jgi:ABC-2 type transport system permease protein
MRAILTLSGLTIREALRRRITLGAFVIGLLFVGLLYLPHTASHRHGVELSPEFQGELLARFGIGMMKFFSAVLAIALASGAVSTELERGTLYAILSKPIHRPVVIIGKWLGLVTIILANLVVWGILVRGLALTAVYPMMFLTLALWFSTFASGVLGTALCVVAVGVGWQEGLMRELAEAFDLNLLRNFAIVAGYLVPIGRLHRWILQVADLQQMPFAFPGPGARTAPDPTASDLVYVGLYIAAVFALAIVTFQRRDV